MLGSRVTVRLAAGVPNAYTRPFALALPVTLLPSVAFSPQRSYAAVGRPRKAVGEPTTTVKRAVKRAAAEKNPEATKTSKNTKVTKPNKDAVKPVKELTEEQKARAKAKEDKAELEQLKELALPLPKNLAIGPSLSAWVVFSSEKLRENIPSTFGSRIKELSHEFKALSAAEREHYNHIANETSRQRAQAYKDWIHSHTSAQITRANFARSRLRARLPKRAKRYPKIIDERAEKRPPGTYAIFMAERISTGDFKGLSGRQSLALIGEEWRALSDGEKQKYVDSAAKLRQEHATRQTTPDGTS